MCYNSCQCKTCVIANSGDGALLCGDCYIDSQNQCKSGGIYNCIGYVPKNPIKRLWWRITGRLFWWQ